MHRFVIFIFLFGFFAPTSMSQDTVFLYRTAEDFSNNKYEANSNLRVWKVLSGSPFRRYSCEYKLTDPTEVINKKQLRKGYWCFIFHNTLYYNGYPGRNGYAKVDSIGSTKFFIAPRVPFHGDPSIICVSTILTGVLGASIIYFVLPPRIDIYQIDLNTDENFPISYYGLGKIIQEYDPELFKKYMLEKPNYKTMKRYYFMCKRKQVE